MTTTDILHHDLVVVRRTVVGKLLFALSFGAVLGGILTGYALSNSPVTTDSLVLSLWLVAGTVLPFGSLVTSAITLAADRESGRLRLLFGTPVTKSDVFMGTLLSRLVVVCVSVVAGFTLVGLVVVMISADVTQRSLWVLAVFTLQICVVYTSVGMAVSAMSPTRLRAVGVALVFYVWSALWPHIVRLVGGSERTQFGEPTSTERLAHFVGTLSPFGAYSQVVTPARAIYAESVSGPLLATSTMSLILVVWAVIPVYAGYWWFSQVDL